MRQEACAAAREALPVESNEAVASTPEAAIRDGELEGVLQVVGEAGYRAASVRAVLEFSGGHRRQFYEHFDSLEDCYTQAYGVWIDRLGVSLLEAAVAGEGWQAAVRSGLVELLRFVSQKPAIARALFVEVQVAGGAALVKHEQAIERLAKLLDGVRSELDAEQAPPEATGVFILGGVEAAVSDALAAGDASRIWDSLPELMHLIVGSYLGREAASQEFEAARELLLGDRVGLAGEER